MNNPDTSTKELREAVSTVLIPLLYTKEKQVDRIMELFSQALQSAKKDCEREARYDELEKVRWILQRHNPQNTLAAVYIELNLRSADIMSTQPQEQKRKD